MASDEQIKALELRIVTLENRLATIATQPTFVGGCMIAQPAFVGGCMIAQPAFVGGCMIAQPVFVGGCMIAQPVPAACLHSDPPPAANQQPAAPASTAVPEPGSAQPSAADRLSSLGSD